jgi:hypothetical protein
MRGGNGGGDGRRGVERLLRRSGCSNTNSKLLKDETPLWIDLGLLFCIGSLALRRFSREKTQVLSFWPLLGLFITHLIS